MSHASSSLLCRAGAAVLVHAAVALLLPLLPLLLAADAVAGPGALRVSSPSFTAGGAIPAKYTCTGGDVSPPLEWSEVPAGTRSLVLVVDDPDAPDPAAPKRTWVHWVLFNLPADATSLAEGAGNTAAAAPARAGLNDWSKARYGGPCPPIGRHRYFFRLYALDVVLDGLDAPTRRAVDDAAAGHVLAAGELVGTFAK